MCTVSGYLFALRNAFLYSLGTSASFSLDGGADAWDASEAPCAAVLVTVEVPGEEPSSFPLLPAMPMMTMATMSHTHHFLYQGFFDFFGASTDWGALAGH
ncbi:MAG: hypothetical protein MR654_04925 [Corynebacterium glucuronolyticum]|nr:hypothetical protein [Corynebacterium glucuronolyticum]